MTNLGGLFALKNAVNNGWFAICGRSFTRQISIKTASEHLGLPPPPKKPINAFMNFVVRSTESMTGLKQTEKFKKAATMWTNLNPSEKEQLNEKYKHDMIEYKAAVDKYLESLDPESREKLLACQKEMSKKNAKDIGALKMSELGKPKAPPSAYAVFVKENFSQRTETQTVRGLIKDLAAQWKNMSDADKVAYQKKSQERQVEYEKELKLWREKLIELGHFDVLKAAPKPKSI